jgi:hypothetical protein
MTQVALKDRSLTVLKASRPISILVCLLLLGNAMMHSRIQPGPFVFIHLVSLSFTFAIPASISMYVKYPLCYDTDIT